MTDRPTLLADYTTKAMRRFAQFDVHFNTADDDMLHPDEDGDALMGGLSYDFGNFDGVRLRFPAGMPQEYAIRAARKLAAWLEQIPPDEWERYAGTAEEPNEYTLEDAPGVLKRARRITKERRRAGRAMRGQGTVRVGPHEEQPF